MPDKSTPTAKLSTYIPVSLMKDLRIASVQSGMKIYGIVQIAIEEKLTRLKDEQVKRGSISNG